MSFKDISQLKLWRPFWSVEQNHLCHFGREHYEKQFYETILDLDQWFRRSCLKLFLITRALAAPFHFGRGHRKENSMKLFSIWTSGLGGDNVQKISYLKLWRPSCSAEQNHLCDFGSRHYGEHSCEIILKLDRWFRRRCCLKKKIVVQE